MTFNLFIKKVQNALQAFCGDDTSLEVQKVTKNNGIEMTGLIIRGEDQDIATTIYLDPFYQEYESGITMNETVSRIIRLYEEHKVRQDMDMSFFNHYEQVKPRLACRLIHRDKNRGLLAKAPHREICDLAVICHCMIIGDEFGCASVVIEYSHMKFWEVTEEELFRDMFEMIILAKHSNLYGMNEAEPLTNRLK